MPNMKNEFNYKLANLLVRQQESTIKITIPHCDGFSSVGEILTSKKYWDRFPWIKEVSNDEK